MELGQEYYNISFGKANNRSLTHEQRVSELDYMEGLRVGLSIINALEEQYQIDLENLEQGTENE